MLNLQIKRFISGSKMGLKFLSAQKAASLDKYLMSDGAYSIDQLMELAGLSVASAVYKVYPPSQKPNVLIIAGPGNNGGDGLVAARHLFLFGYKPFVYYPKRSKSDLYNRLVKQLENFNIPFVDNIDKAMDEADQVVDAIFGFSFHPPVREPFTHVISLLETTNVPVTSVDIPSSWDVDKGIPSTPPGSKFNPEVLVSLTAPKPAASFFNGRHFLGGRFISQKLADEWGFEVPKYHGSEQVAEYKHE